MVKKSSDGGFGEARPTYTAVARHLFAFAPELVSYLPVMPFEIPDLFVVLALLAMCVVLFVVGRPRMDVVAFFPIIALPLLGILSMSEALAGFCDSSVILIAALFVIGEGLVRTGIAFRMGDWLIHKSGNSEARLLVFLMIAVAALGSVMSSTGVVAIFIPVVMSVANRLRIAPGRLLMPLSFAGLISGMMTLVATAPNMVVDGALRRENHEGFSFFSFTPMGVVVLVMGIGYMLFARRWLVVRDAARGDGAVRRSFKNFREDYKLADRTHFLRVSPDSPLVGRTLQDSQLRGLHKVNILGIERQERFGHALFVPNAHTLIQAGDAFLAEAHFDENDLKRIGGELKLEPLPLPAQGSFLTDQTREFGMAEVILPPESDVAGRTIPELNFRSKYHLNVVGIRRKRQALENDLMEKKLREGDTLLVSGEWKSIKQLQAVPHDFIVLSLPTEADEIAPALRRAPWALLSLAVMIVLMVTGVVPNVIAALIGCLLMGLFGCLDVEGAYKSINWGTLVLIAGMIPFATALEKTGGVTVAVDGLLGVLGADIQPHLLLAVLFAVTALVGLFISNTATAVLMAPIALKIAERIDASPLPFAMIVALAASAAFMTPVSSPVNMLVMTPGRYRFGDFVKIGVPFAILVMVVSVLLVPILFPLK